MLKCRDAHLRYICGRVHSNNGGYGGDISLSIVWRSRCDGHCFTRGGKENLAVFKRCLEGVEQVNLQLLDLVLQRRRGTPKGSDSGGSTTILLSRFVPPSLKYDKLLYLFDGSRRSKRGEAGVWTHIPWVAIREV